MGSVGTPVIRRMVQVSKGPDSPEELLASVGLPPEAEDPTWAGESVDEEAYYGLIERIVAGGDESFPLRYGEALRVDDLGALGLSMKTAPTVEDALQRLVRYVLVLSDTLEYELVDVPSGRVFTLTGRPHHRKGAALANECALAACTSALRQVAGQDLSLLEVTFRHQAMSDGRAHRGYFGCPVRFDAESDGIHLDHEQLARRTELADEGLSTYLLAQLDDLKARSSQRSLVDEVRSAVADSLPDGQPTKSQIARRLAMSERTLHRRLAEEGESFQGVVTAARRQAAESLLRSGRHSVGEVAFLTGFGDQSAFTRAFKRWTGTTPAAFRQPGD